MPVKQISAEETKKLLDSGDGYTYVDVRSEIEFEQGHPKGAINIPLRQFNRQTQMLHDNPDFLAVMEANFPKDAKLVMGCATGNRSNVAGMMLLERGYEDVANMLGGFNSARDMMGNELHAGWATSDYPVETGDGGEGSYEKALEKLQ